MLLCHVMALGCPVLCQSPVSVGLLPLSSRATSRGPVSALAVIHSLWNIITTHTNRNSSGRTQRHCSPPRCSPRGWAHMLLLEWVSNWGINTSSVWVSGTQHLSVSSPLGTRSDVTPLFPSSSLTLQPISQSVGSTWHLWIDKWMTSRWLVISRGSGSLFGTCLANSSPAFVWRFEMEMVCFWT